MAYFMRFGGISMFWRGIGASLISWFSRQRETQLDEMRGARSVVSEDVATPSVALNGRVLRSERASSALRMPPRTPRASSALRMTPRMARMATSEPPVAGPSSRACLSIRAGATPKAGRSSVGRSKAAGRAGSGATSATSATPSTSGAVRRSDRRRPPGRMIQAPQQAKKRRGSGNRQPPLEKPRRGRPSSTKSPTSNEFEVEQILASEMCFLVKWKGYPRTQATWEPRANLKCKALLQAFQKKNGGRVNKRGRGRR